MWSLGDRAVAICCCSNGIDLFVKSARLGATFANTHCATLTLVKYHDTTCFSRGWCRFRSVCGGYPWANAAWVQYVLPALAGLA